MIYRIFAPYVIDIMEKKLLFFATAMMLLLLGLISCSTDDAEPDGWITEIEDRVILLSEDTPYPDSVMYYHFLIPCKPVAREELPQWLCDYMIRGAFPGTVVQGEWVDSGESLYGIIPSSPSSQYSINFYADGTPFNITPGPRDDGYDGYGDFLSATTNWRCIFKIKIELGD